MDPVLGKLQKSARSLPNPHLTCKVFALGCSLLVPAGAAIAADEIRGQADVVSGNEVIVGKKPVRLFGIAAPSLKDRCQINEAKIKCGVVAWAELIKLADGQLISCDREEPAAPKTGTPAAKTADSTVYATCYIGETDVNEAMVRSGWARAVPEQTDRYEVDETDARQSRRGIWATRGKSRRSR